MRPPATAGASSGGSIVDTKVQKNAVDLPAGNRLLKACRQKLVETGNQNGKRLRQSYARKGSEYARRAGRYGHARQVRRMRRMLSKQGPIIDRRVRDIDGNKASSMRLAFFMGLAWA